MVANKQHPVALERGFTLIELLVVILIMAILAAVAIPVFLKQREKGWEAQVRSGLKNAQPAIESFGIDNNGFSQLNAEPQLETRLGPHGFRMPNWASNPGYFRIKSTSTTYCIEARHRLMPTTNEWALATFDSSVGAPSGVPHLCP